MDPIVITADPRVAIPVTLVGEDYSLTPPKAALAMKMAVYHKTHKDDPSKMMEVVEEWTNKAFGKETGKAIRKRIEDDKDLLDITHVMKLMEAVVDQQADSEDPPT